MPEPKQSSANPARIATQSVTGGQKPVSEKKEFLRREEIRTMQKEINKIREEGAQKEREKITGTEAGPSVEKKPGAAKSDGETKKIAEETERIRSFLEQVKKRAEEETPQRPASARPEPALAGQRPAFAKSYGEAKPPLAQPRHPDKITPKAPVAILQKNQIEKDLQELSLKIQSLRAEKSRVAAEEERLSLGLAPIYEKEKIIEIKKRTIEEKESKTTEAEEKKRVELERWEIEKQRQNIEKERWSVEEDIESCKNELKKIDPDLQQILAQKNEIEKQKEEIEKKEEESKLREEKARLEKEMENIETGWSSTEEAKNSKLAKKNKIADDLKKILENEKNIEEAIKQLEQKESLAADPQDKRKIEQERQQMEIKRAELEKNKWDAETENSNAGSELKKIESSQREAAQRKDAIKSRLQEIASQISSSVAENFQEPARNALPARNAVSTAGWHNDAGGETQKEIAPKPIMPEKIASIESAERQNVPQGPTQTWTKPNDGFDEKMEYLKYQEMPYRQRGQLKTPQKQEEIARRNFLERTQEIENRKSAPLPEKTIKDYQRNQEFATPSHQKQSWLEKIWVRFLLIVLTGAIIFLVVYFWYWYLKINK